MKSTEYKAEDDAVVDSKAQNQDIQNEFDESVVRGFDFKILKYVYRSFMIIPVLVLYSSETFITYFDGKNKRAAHQILFVKSCNIYINNIE